MVALKDADVSWLSNAPRVANLELYSQHPDLLVTVPAKQEFWRRRKLLTLNDVVRINGILDLLDKEIEEVDDAKKKLKCDLTNQVLVNNLRNETADVAVFAKTFQIFSNGTWAHNRGRVLEAVRYAKDENAKVGGDLAKDVIGVVKGKNNDNYLTSHFDWGWMLADREEVCDEAVIAVYDVAKAETRILRDEHGDDGVLPNWLGFAMMQAIRARDEKQLGVWLRDPIVSASMEAMLTIYEVAVNKFG